MHPTVTLAPIVAVARADVDASAPLADALRALNNAHGTELSWLEPERLSALVGTAFQAARIGEVDAFLLAFDQDAAHDSPNFRWFRARYDRFVYVDRVVVAPHARRRGLARQLYAHLIERARAAQQPRIVCEVNAVPPNPASDGFHRALGFGPVGSGKFRAGKVVRYLSLKLAAGAGVRP